MTNSNGSRQKVIAVKEVKSYINRGFEYVASLPDGKDETPVVKRRSIKKDDDGIGSEALL